MTLMKRFKRDPKIVEENELLLNLRNFRKQMKLEDLIDGLCIWDIKYGF